ncbi:MAG: glutamine--fructose-6-phosphate transaminase (isomerizing) [Tyzzerella sp.]|nr:glutamine--fructose-6-phosphate transaminase (isomerizing) [Tyzzerella sp.]
MCGIVGYTGVKDAREILLDSLELLEHRGYDSVGIARFDSETSQVCVDKCVGRVRDLRRECEQETLSSTCGIGHTRWATHGAVLEKNAHPHRCGKVTIVHNGIVENYRQLIENYELQEQLVSETDTEVVAALLDHYYHGDAQRTIQKVAGKLKGTYALVMMFEDQPGVIYAIRNVSPIVVAECEEGMMLASDLTALGQFTKQYFVMPEHAVLKMEADRMTLVGFDGNVVEPELLTLDWEMQSLGKNGYPFYMEKEIMEQPDTFMATVKNRIVNGLPDFTVDGVSDEALTSCKRICVVACGTAWHAGLMLQALVKSVLHMHIDVELASEFMYSDPVINENTLLIAVSQSGETVDTLEAVKYAKQKGAKCLAVLNVRGSSIARESDYVLYTEAGPEIAVASTKAYTTQLAVMYLLVAKMALLRGEYTVEETRHYMEEFQRVPEAISKVLEQRKEIHVVAKNVLEAKDLFMIGRGMDYSTLLEGSLKLKEVSYIHSEAYAAGELKHGPIALIAQDVPVVALVTQEKLMSKELSNIKEVKARGASVVLFIKQSLAEQLKEDYELVLLPDLEDKFMVFPAVVALQLLAYYVSSDKGFDVDKPRNLAKVVTVE